MFVIVDERNLVTSGYAAQLAQEGVSCACFCGYPFREWITTAGEAEIEAVEAFLIGDAPGREELPPIIRLRTKAPMICMNDAPSLQLTLGQFRAGADDVVRKPIHVREILARVHAIRNRAFIQQERDGVDSIQIACDGGDAIVGGKAFPLPRREKRVLECLLANRGRRLTKMQIFSAVYGVFDDVEENVVECHISKLRKKLRERLGYDPIDSQRFLGYQLVARLSETREDIRATKDAEAA